MRQTSPHPVYPKDNLRFLDSLNSSRQKLGLERMAHILNTLGNPQDTLPMVHITGTNGKGSVTAILESILCAAGFGVGMFSSPHLIHPRERIRLNGANISESEFEQGIAELRTHVEETLGLPRSEWPTYFEWLNILAYQFFTDHRADITLFEVGLGGRLDSTNIVKSPTVTVITGIGLDHAHILGDTLEKIALEKAGILKPGVPLVLGPDIASEARNAILQTADALEVPVIESDRRRFEITEESSLERGLFLREPTTLKRFILSLRAPYQRKNLATALAVVDVLKEQGWAISDEALEQGLASVQWPARFQTLPEKRLIVDGSHNAQGFDALREAVAFYLPDTKIHWLCSLQNNRPLVPLQDMLLSLPQTQSVIWSLAAGDDKTGRFHLPKDAIEQMRERMEKLGKKNCTLETAASAKEAFERLTARLEEDSNAYGIVTGSLYTAGDILNVLYANPYD